MLRSVRIFSFKSKHRSVLQKQTFLTNNYKCLEAWNTRVANPILSKVNLNDFYISLDQNFTSKGVISAIDVEIFANAVNDPTYLDEMKDLLMKLRLSAETGNTLQSTHHAAVRNFIDYGHTQDLIDILKDPLTYGLFLDDYTANILLDKLLTSEKFDQAASVASLVMLQEEYSNKILCSLCQYACYKYILQYTPPEPKPVEETNKKVEEKKIRVKYLRNPYFDNHFDLEDPLALSGKTLAWISETANDNLSKNLEIIGWLFFKKYDKLVAVCSDFAKLQSSKVYKEVKDLLKRESTLQADNSETINNCLSTLDKIKESDGKFEDALKFSIENAINKSQNNDIDQQKQLFKSWAELREKKLSDQTKRLDRARRIQIIQEQQSKLSAEEQKLWFFENEEQIDLQIEEKELKTEVKAQGKSSTKKSDEDYIPPEIVRGRK